MTHLFLSEQRTKLSLWNKVRWKTERQCRSRTDIFLNSFVYCKKKKSLCAFWCSSQNNTGAHTHIIKVDDHGAVAHVCGLVVGLPADGEGHPSWAGAHRHAQSVSGRLRGRSGVTHYQTFPLQDDGLCVILGPGALRPPHQDEEEEETQQWGEVGEG